MKAEHRKELKTNELADRLGRFATKMRTESRTTTFVVIGFVVIVVAILIWFFVARSAGASRADLWLQVGDAAANDNVKQLEQLANEQRGSLIGRTAKFQLARILMRQGLRNLGAPLQRQQAIEDIEKARALYKELVPQCSDAPLLAQEALMGQAKAEEALIGIPKADNPNESRGSVEVALRLYEQLAAAQPPTFQTEKAAQYVQLLKEHGARITKFYDELEQMYPRGH
ncbi:MAG: hypothetical protein ACK4RK_08815 [Gemmataceae bacterium]